MTIKKLVYDMSMLPYKKRPYFIINYLESKNIMFNIQKFNGFRNIEVVFPGKFEKSILFSAHFDISTNTIQGANDNTSSVAVLLTLCDILKNQNYQLNKTVRILFNDNEELLGSFYTPDILKSKLKDIINNTGMYNYMKVNHTLIEESYILELSGYGDSFFVANKSGGIKTDVELNMKIYHYTNENCFFLSTPSTDHITSFFFDNLKSTVVGKINSNEAENWKNYKKKPLSWERIHTKNDTIDYINENSLLSMLNLIHRICKE